MVLWVEDQGDFVEYTLTIILKLVAIFTKPIIRHLLSYFDRGPV